MALAMARYVNTLGYEGASGTTVFPSGGAQAYFDTARKTTPLVSHNTSGSGVSAISSFTLNAAGVWEISAGAKATSTGNANVWICSGQATAAAMAASGPVRWADAVLIREFNLSSPIYIYFATASGVQMDTTNDLCSVQFLYHGAI